MFGKKKHSVEFHGNIPHETSVLGKQFNVPLISCIEKYGSSVSFPVGRVDQISLRVQVLVPETEMVDLLFVKLGFPFVTMDIVECEN